MSQSQHLILAARSRRQTPLPGPPRQAAGHSPTRSATRPALYVESDGIATLLGLKDLGTDRAASPGGLLGIIGGPIGVLASSGIGTSRRGCATSDSATDN